MRKKVNKRIKSDNRGFSLVETIIGILILGIIITPLLHALLSSANLSAKARRYKSATDAAQSVVETVLAEGIDRLITEATTPASTMGDLVDSVGFYTFNGTSYTPMAETELELLGERDDVYYLGLKGINTQQGVYDAMVKLDATTFDSNVNAVSIYTEMDGVFSQPFTADENPDLLAAAYFSDQATVYSGTEVTIDHFMETMNRAIEITVTKIPDAEGLLTGVITGEVEFLYTATYDGVDLESTYDTEFFRSVYDENDDGVDSLFFFYYPNYTAPDAATGGEETITVCNDDDVEFSLFIVKQKQPGYTDEELLTCELKYADKLTLTLYEPDRKIAFQEPRCSLYSNVNTSLVMSGEIRPGKKYIYQVRSPSAIAGQWNLWRQTQYDIPSKLVYSKAVNRLYAVTVSLYEAGKDYADSSKILTFDSTQIE